MTKYPEFIEQHENRKILRVIWDCYRELYKQATPKANIDQLYKKGITKKENFFMKYCLEEEKQIKIIKDICEKNKLKERDASTVSATVMLGSAPTYYKKQEKNK